MSRSWVVVFVAIALPVLIVGCGGGGGGSSGDGAEGGDQGGLVTIQGNVDLGDVPADEAEILLDGQPINAAIGDDGSFILAGIPEGDHIIQVVSRDGMRGGAARVRARGRRVRLTRPIDLHATGQIVGIVVKRENGKEERVAGVEVIARADVVWIQTPEGRREIRPRRAAAEGGGDATALIYPPPPDSEGPTYSAFTDDDGAYQMKGVEPGQYLVTCALAGYRPAQAWVHVSANRTAVADLVLLPEVTPGIATISGTVSGRSSDGSAAPIAGAEVVVLLRQPWRPCCGGEPISVVDSTEADEGDEEASEVVVGPDIVFQRFRTLTDEQGHYTLNVPAGEGTAMAWARGYRRAVRRLTLQGGSSVVVDFVLEKANVKPPAPPEPPGPPIGPPEPLRPPNGSNPTEPPAPPSID